MVFQGLIWVKPTACLVKGIHNLAMVVLIVGFNHCMGISDCSESGFNYLYVNIAGYTLTIVSKIHSIS